MESATQPAPFRNTGVSADAAYRLIHDELSLDGSPVLNLASFVHTWMPPQADSLVRENISKNLIDSDEYPATQIIHTRCVSILADLWHAPSAKEAIGTATTGSSEAAQLGGLAMKKIWQEKRKATGKSLHDPGPNIVMGANAQVALEKFARYFDVECRLVSVSVESKYRLDPQKAMKYVDENTIGVFVILGSTYTGHYEPVKEMSDLLDEYEAKSGHFVPIHVDAASGGFVAPFVTPKLQWDFKLPRVVSINTSGHKFGLSYVGVGWVVWRDKQHLPKDLIFELHYLGSVEYSFSLNFSRPAAPIIAQYFNFIHLGFEGYRSVGLADMKNARLLSRALEKTGYYTVLSDIHRGAYEPGLPVVSFRLSDNFQNKYPEIQQKWIQTLLRAKGWIVPNYELAPDLQQVEILRVVVRENVTEILIDKLIADIIEVTEQLKKADSSAHALDALGHVQRPQKHESDASNLKAGEGSQASNPVLVPRVLEVEKGRICYIMGTVYMDMPLKPNVMEDIARDQSIPPPPPQIKMFSEDDNVMLEDESGRIRLVGERIKEARLVTGVIMSALGMETPNGDFEVIDYCFAGLAPQASDTESNEDKMDVDAEEGSLSQSPDEWIGGVSGLDIGSLSPSDAQIQMLVEYLTGEGGNIDDQVAASQISRLIIAGNSLAAIEPQVIEPALTAEDRKARRAGLETTSFSPHPILNLSSTLYDIASVMPIHLLPGDSDPSGIIMPQQPFPRAMFGDAARYPTFACETNPTYLSIASDPESSSSNSPRPSVKRTLLINSGQPLNDMFKYLPTPPNTRLSIAESSLRWRHMSPTAPDTLWCHPYREEDPFLIPETPDIYIVGGQEKFATRLVTERSERKGAPTTRCRIVLVPSFAHTGILVLINLRTLAVKTVNFGVHGMTTGRAVEDKNP
ncbi:hypothetical protein NLJ89_g1677 [Agrocybe chaxingu]|uniref:Glutamate decarboxylase n=1 Tax=Agrocybe chaxingu TaxID=84603 RepID=A0A9W8MZK4_9AGAR|nr:hypothetical protein NLJ89_g1677 [Agrocybe chaxingu]